ncbi:MAG: tautomerase family protein [Candidatus Goldiibacteriota bacterium HGW-Goldbacteria-1]|jgi:phenylpyruvate tautomerase PptA (4-oxalocrotonate tautomerase family)|nr:MAG: tautomerase family protein [Candidatus Goldiibacteriota bacterium HGW-Goldbacteria-1]
MEGNMPKVTISLKKGKTAEEKKVIFGAVHKALMDAFKIPQTDRTLFMNEYEPENMDGKEGFTLVEVSAFKGRTQEMKKLLYRLIVENLKNDAGIDPQAVMIIIYDVPKEDWGIRGGQMASEIIK